MITLIAKILKMLNAETAPSQISLGICFAMIMGLTPLWSLHNLPVLLLVMLLRVNLSAFIVSWGLFSCIAYLLDPVFHTLGYKLLTLAPLNGLWTSLYNIPLFRLAGFNNSIRMGSLVVSVILFIPLFLVLNMLIRQYRERILAWVKKTKLAETLNASRLISVYKALTEGGRS
ncbi:MAG: TIGR03546 family protein [Thermodesulfobacteriota bacterium]|nr:TIGR03546 family protein [Thermodesulfobacteriota bacterium]